MPAEGLGFLSERPTCSPLSLGDDYLGNFADGAIATGIEAAMSALGLDDRYVNALQDAQFFCKLKTFVLYDAIVDNWMFHVANNIATVIMAAATAFITLWVVTTGLKMMNGMYREPFSVVMLQGAKMVLVFGLISALTSNTDTVIQTVLGLQEAVGRIVTGSNQSVDKLIDMNLGIGQFASMVAEDVRDSMADQSSERGVGGVFAGALGQTGPAVLTSMLVMLSQIAIAFALMLGPLFLFFLLFKSTSSMFWGWLKFLFSTFLALCFVSIVSTIAMSATLSYGLGIAFSAWLNSLAGSESVGISTAAQAAIRIITGNLGAGSARVDLSGSNSNLAAMGAMFSIIIVATPALVMQLFNTSMGYASNLMGAMGVPRAGLGGYNQQAANGNVARAKGDEVSIAHSNTAQALNHVNRQQQSDEFRPGNYVGGQLPGKALTVSGEQPGLTTGAGSRGLISATNTNTNTSNSNSNSNSNPTSLGSSPSPTIQPVTSSTGAGATTSSAAGDTSSARIATNTSRKIANENNGDVTDVVPRRETPTTAPSNGSSKGTGQPSHPSRNTGTAEVLNQHRRQDLAEGKAPRSRPGGVPLSRGLQEAQKARSP